MQWAKKIYAWTKQNLQDKTDFLYYDNINLNGKISKEKYAYNSGQMLQAAVLLYQLTKDKSYLADAHQLAAACYAYYFDEAKVVNGKNIKLMKRGDTWFTAVMLRGFIELYGVDKDRKYIDSFQQNLDYVAQFARDEHRFFENDWSGKEKKASKWLLPQGAMVEMYARLAAIR